MASSKQSAKGHPNRFSSSPTLHNPNRRYGTACKQRFRNAVNDRIGLEPDKPESP